MITVVLGVAFIAACVAILVAICVDVNEGDDY
jgi:hypothetical protein